MSSSGIPRELLKWIQSLDLSYSVKNARRDLSNGFLIAEIISRYFSNEIQMHSFDNGAGLKAKKDNWFILNKYFKKKGIPIKQEFIDNVLNNKSNAVIPIIKTVYTYLTERKIKKSKPKHSPSVPLPSFAKPTRSTLVRDGGRSEMYTKKNLKSLKYSKQKLSNYLSKKTKKTGKEGDSNKNGGGLFSKSKQKVNTRTISKYLDVHSELNDIVESILEKGQCLNKLDQRKDFVISFLESCDEIPTQISINLFKNIQQKLISFADSMLQYPKEYWKFTCDLMSGLNKPVDSISFKESVFLFEELGNILVQKDQNSTWNLFEDFAYIKILPLLINEEEKRLPLLQVLFSHCANDPAIHIEVIRTLQDKLDNNEVFIPCLTKLITLENEFSLKLIDMYIYYCVMGISMPNPKTRAASLSMLQVISNADPETVYQMLDRIGSLVNDNWWEVQAQLLVVCSILLGQIDETERKQDYETIISIIMKVLSNAKTTHLKKIILSYLTPLLKKYPDLCSDFISILLSLQLEDLMKILSQKSDFTETFKIGSSCQYKIISIPYHWHSIGISNALTEHIQENKLENFEIQHCAIINACLKTALSQIGGKHNDIQAWSAVLKDNQNHLFVGLCDEELCKISSEIIVQFFSLLQTEALKSIPQLIRVLEVIYKPRTEVPKICQKIIPGFLIDIYNLGGPFKNTLYQLAMRMSQQNMDQTPLGSFIDKVLQEEKKENKEIINKEKINK